MSAGTVLRRVRQLLAVVVVATLAATCLAGATTTTAAPSAEGAAPLVSAPVRLAAYQTAATSDAGAGNYERWVSININRTRKKHGLRPVWWATCTDRAANRWASYLAGADKFHHQSMGTLLRRCHAQYVGETLGRGTMPPRTLVKMWMDSPPHRKILLSRSPRSLGIGAARTKSGQWVVAANFMRL